MGRHSKPAVVVLRKMVVLALFGGSLAVFDGFWRLPNIAIVHRVLPLWDFGGFWRLPKVRPAVFGGFQRCCTSETFVFGGSPASSHSGGCGFLFRGWVLCGALKWRAECLRRENSTMA